MKIKFSKFWTLIVTLFMVACTPESDFIETESLQGNNIESILVTAKDFEGSENLTRTAVEVSNSGASFTWSANDTIGIFPVTGYQVAFPMESGAGTKSASFDGGGWALKNNTAYAAYYPFRYENRNRKEVAITYVGQLQQGNADTKHIGAFDYMAASATTPSEGSVAFNFEHLGALVQWKLKVPENGIFTSFTVESEQNVFIRNGNLDLSQATPSITSIEKVTSLSMDLKNVSTTSSGQEIIVYMMMPPAELSGQNLTLLLTNDNAEVATAHVEGQNLEAGKAYAFTATCSAFEACDLQIANRKGKVIGSNGGTITLDYLSNVACQAILSDEAKEWISPVYGRSLTQRSLSFEIKENPNNKSRRSTITIRSANSNLAIEYTILQGGQDSYAITEENNNFPIGILTSEQTPTGGTSALAALLDGNISTYCEFNSQQVNFVWESPYEISISAYQIAINANSYGVKEMTIHVSDNGSNWNSLGWGVSFSMSNDLSIVNGGMSARSTYYKILILSNQGAASTRISELGLSEDLEADKPITTFQELVSRGHSFTQSASTPMGNHYENKHVTTDADRTWLSTATNEPNLLPSASGYTWRNYEVNLYPFGTPVPADVNQHGIGDCSALAVFAEMAYLFPDFIKSIITNHGNGTYTVAMYDPQGQPVNVTVQSTFLGDNAGIGASSGKDGKANWATIMEKAIMKWNYIYEVNPDINGIGSEHVAPLFTGEGNSFAFSPNQLNAEQLGQAVKVALDNRMIVIGGFNKDGLSVNGPQTVTMHAFSFMQTAVADAMFAMRNPWGNSPNGSEGDDGILNIVNDGIVPPTIDLRIIYPGAAKSYAVTNLSPYIPPTY